MRMKLAALWTSLVAGLLLMSGCAALVAGGAAAGGTYAYVSGWLERTYQAPLEESYQASLDAVQEMGLQVEERSQKVGEAEIQAKEGDTTYWIQLNSQGPDQTEIRVRAGWLGDEQASERIHESIAQNL